MNNVAQSLTGWTAEEAAGKASEEIFNIVNETTRAIVESPITRVLREGTTTGLANHTILVRKDKTEVPVDDSGAPITDTRGKTIGTVLVFRDITGRREAEQEQMRLHEEQVRLQSERLRLQDERVRMQAERLAELSTPLIPLTNEILIMPLIGTIDSDRAAQVLDALSSGVAIRQGSVEKRGMTIVIVDITGVVAVDTHVAGTLIDAAKAVRLLGAEVVLTGIRPQVAQTLISLGINFEGLATRSTLQRGIAYAVEHLRRNAGMTINGHETYQ